MDVTEARISWAASFLVDWIIPLLEDNQIDNRSEIVELRKTFPPFQVKNEKGIDFSLNDVLTAALRRKAYEEKLYPGIPIEELENGEALLQVIDLLTEFPD